MNPSRKTTTDRRTSGYKRSVFRFNLLHSQATVDDQISPRFARAAPAITVVEPPVPPMERSAPKRTLIVLLSLILGGFLGVGAAFVPAFSDSTKDDAGKQEKLDEIRERLIPERLKPEAASTAN